MSISNKKQFKNTRGLERTILLGIVLFSALLEIICLLAGVSQYLLTTFDALKDEARHEVTMVLKEMDAATLEHLFSETKSRYYEVADDYGQDEANPTGSKKERIKEYEKNFSSIMDDGYESIRKSLYECRKSTEMEDVAFLFYDEERDRQVIVVDGDVTENRFYPGQWIRRKNATKERMDEIAVSPFAMDIRRGSFGGWTVTDYIVLEDTAGEAMGYASVYWDVTEVMHRIRRFMIVSFPIIILLVSFFAWVIMHNMRKQFLLPILEIAECAREYSKIDAGELENTEPIFKGLTMKAPTELEELSFAMQAMEQTVAEDMKQIRLMTAAHERVETELSLARRIQMSLLPKVTDEMAASEEYDVFGFMRPAHEVGGDFYDFFITEEGKLAFLVADVSDKGAGAAMFMAVSRSMIRMRALMGGTPAEVLADVDKLVSGMNGQTMFVTVWMGLIDISTGEVAVCNAGHEYPMWCSNDSKSDHEGRFGILEQEHGTPLAFFPDMPFIPAEFTMSPGDSIILFTDGVTEANNVNGEMFETDRLLSVLNENPTGDISELCLKLRDSVDEFAKDAKQFDDITILGLRYNGRKDS